MPVVLSACEEGGYAYEYHHGTIGYGVFTYALAKEFPQSAGGPSDRCIVHRAVRTRERDDEDATLRSNL